MLRNALFDQVCHVVATLLTPESPSVASLWLTSAILDVGFEIS